MIHYVNINQIYITLVYSRDTISKRMRTLNVKLIIEASFEFCHTIGLKDLPFVSLMWFRCNYLPVNCMTRVFNKCLATSLFLSILEQFSFHVISALRFVSPI